MSDMKKAFDKIQRQFKSANSVDVERATVLRSDWELAKQYMASRAQGDAEPVEVWLGNGDKLIADIYADDGSYSGIGIFEPENGETAGIGVPDGSIDGQPLDKSNAIVLIRSTRPESLQVMVDELQEAMRRLNYTHLPKTQAEAWKAEKVDYNRAIHHNPDAKAWAEFFMETFPHCGADPETMHGWFANAMMAMYDHLKNSQPAHQGVPHWKELEALADE